MKKSLLASFGRAAHEQETEPDSQHADTATSTYNFSHKSSHGDAGRSMHADRDAGRSMHADCSEGTLRTHVFAAVC